MKMKTTYNMKKKTTYNMKNISSKLGLPVIAAMISSLATGTSHGEITPLDIRLDPTLHFRAVHGNTTMHDGMEGLGGHDPSQDNFNFQGFEIGTSLHIGEYVKGFATVNVYKLDGDDFDAEFEEGFLKLVNLPGGFELRGGRILSRLGIQNARHLHAWDFADANLMNVRFLGEEGFAVDGTEITWLAPTPWEDALSIGFGSAVAHDHEHGEEHGDDDDGGDEDHGHGEEAEMARPEKNIVAIRYQALFGPSDFHRFRAGGSFLTGDNGFDRTTRIYGADFTYTWREKGLESGGKQFRWRNEWLMRDVDTDEGGFKDNGYSTALLYEFIEGWEAGLRYDYVEGVSDPMLAERRRISPSITKHFDFGNDLRALVRLQYNHDDIDGHENEDSVWLQFGFDWGPGEVR